MLRSPRRLALAGLGIVCVGLAGLGVVVPGLPTTIFLIMASYLFTRSCPWLEEKLIRRGPFQPYLRYLDGDEPMPRRARVAATMMMWSAVIVSLGVLAAREALTPWLAVTILAAACCGTIAIASYRRAR
jgi:hypothetical protein